MATELKGTTVRNEDVQGFIRKHGSPSYSKPHGPDEMVLYYPVEAEAEETAEEFEDFAGTKTPATFDRVIQGRKGGTVVTSTERVASAHPPKVHAAQENLNEAAKEAEVSDDPPAENEAAPSGEEDGLEGKTFDELMDIAQERDLEGRSSMNKAELLEALKGQE